MALTRYFSPPFAISYLYEEIDITYREYTCQTYKIVETINGEV